MLRFHLARARRRERCGCNSLRPSKAKDLTNDNNLLALRGHSKKYFDTFLDYLRPLSDMCHLMTRARTPLTWFFSSKLSKQLTALKLLFNKGLKNVTWHSDWPSVCYLDYHVLFEWPLRAKLSMKFFLLFVAFCFFGLSLILVFVFRLFFCSPQIMRLRAW